MKAFNRILIVLLAGVLLAGCGGGGGSNNDSGFNPPGVSVAVAVSGSTLGVNSIRDITATVTLVGGAPVPNGTQVTATVSPTSMGQVSTGTTTPAATAQATTTGGVATFRFHSSNTQGTATVTVSVQDPATPGRTVSRSVNFTVSGPSTDPRLTLQATRTTIPANTFNAPPFIGSPYMAEVTVTWRHLNGQLVNDGSVNVSVNPVGATGGFSMLDDPDTDENEFEIRMGQAPVDVVAGKATIFFHSFEFSGTSTMTVTAVDPDNGETLSATLVFTINNVAPPLPAQLLLSAPDHPVYVQGAGGNTALVLEVDVRDGAGGFVPDPVSGNFTFNNVRLEIIGDGAAFGERLSGVNAQGQNVSGTAITVRTFNGIAGAVFQSGTRLGTTSVRATVDRADNNVDNGIQDGLTADRSITVSDGRLFGITITHPFERALNPNEISSEDASIVPGSVDGEDPLAGIYQLTVSVVATDRGGNPVLPGTQIGFGLIDEPLSGYPANGGGQFALSGVDGDPQESGFNFSAPGGAFQTAGGGAGPGDTLVLFGKDVTGNSDHESARTVQQINSQTLLRVTQRFNPNDTTGVSVNSGAVLPYAIGRAIEGNIATSTTTDEFGRATTLMTYPASRVGKNVIVWAQGSGAQTAAGSLRTVADVEVLRFFAIAPLTVVASPSTIPGNTTANVTVCVYDGVSNPVPGVFIEYGFSGLDTGSGSVDGGGPSGFVAESTGPGGCTVAAVTTTGVLPGTEAQVIFSAGGAQAEVDIVVGQMILQATPSAFVGSGGTVTLRLITSDGSPVPGVQIVGSCTASGGTIGISSGPGVTNENGITTALVAANLNTCGPNPGSGTCTFTTAAGTPSATVSFQGIDVSGFSPECPP
ncbi:MAG TPA: hypothetical protein PKZ76_02745 [Xanthomonadaceae bacterium]|nr:hypothetical protein [Xanthomonadaceae bacterium]